MKRCAIVASAVAVGLNLGHFANAADALAVYALVQIGRLLL